MSWKDSHFRLRSPEGVLLRFSEITSQTINRELHVHTTFADGTQTVSQAIHRAEELGLTHIAFTEHVRADTKWFQLFAEEVRRCAASSTLNVLVGAEARVTDYYGSLDISPAVRECCDIVLGSVHRFPGVAGSVIEFSDVRTDEFAEMEFRLAMGLIQAGGADVLAHPGGMSERILGTFPEDYYHRLLLAASKYGTAIEINSSYLRDIDGFVLGASRVNPLVSIGSDAHRLEQIGECCGKLRSLYGQA